MAFNALVRNPKYLCDGLLSFQNHKKLCDAPLMVNGKRIDVHSIVLAASSKYFENIFVRLKMKEAKFENVDVEAVESIVIFCYTGMIKVTVKNIEEILKMASILLIPSIIETIPNILKNELNADNCLLIWRIARLGRFGNLICDAFTILNENLEKVINIAEFYSLDYSELFELINTDMVANSEKTLYKAVKKWIQFDIASRADNLINLLNCVKLSSLPLDLILSEATLMSDLNKMCYGMFCKAFYCALTRNCNHMIKGMEISTKCMKFYSYTLAVIGSFDPKRSKILEIFDVINNEWVEIDTTCSRTHFTSVLFGEKIMMIGGQLTYNTITNTVECYNLKTGRLESYPPLIHPRKYMSSVLYDGCIYVLGGFHNRPLSYVEKFDPTTNKWTEVTPMSTPRYFFAAEVIGQEIFITGGYEYNFLSSTEAYNPTTDTYRWCAPLHAKRQELGVAVIDNCLYVVGGFDFRESSVTEKYDPATDKWTLLKPISPGRYAMGASTFMGNLVIAGGRMSVYDDLSLVESYDVNKDDWKSMIHIKEIRSSLDLLQIPWDLAESAIFIKTFEKQQEFQII